MNNIEAIGSISSDISTGALKLQDQSWAAQFKTHFEHLNNEVLEGQSAVSQAMLGDKEMMHRAILEINEAKSILQFSTAVRDKLVESYKEIMKMEV
ncbi:MAG: flagellar hook-basal body complex protein FliE [Cycloclasticus sp.]|jgi:Flagellar hook-basal body protein